MLTSHRWCMFSFTAAGLVSAALFSACAAAGTDAVPSIDAGGGSPLLGLVTTTTGTENPTTCDQAAASQSYIGCEFWPTVTFNPVWSIFDFAAIVTNVGTDAAVVTITGPGGVSQSGTVAPLSLHVFYLPWAPELKGGDMDVCSNLPTLTSSVALSEGAYHLTSTVPVVVYQFNALEFRGSGGPPGKDWSSCPGNQICEDGGGVPEGCFSYTNDASLLLPTTALTGNYWITTIPTSAGGSFFAVTGTTNGTTVKVELSASATIRAGGTLTAASGGTQVSFTLNAGDVMEVLADDSLNTPSDLSGSQVQASQPVQVIAGSPCASVPYDVSADAGADLTCDHLEETVLPAETLGHHYIVTVPTAPLGKPIGHVVRFYGSVDGTNLTYPSGNAPANAPTTLAEGQTVDLGIVSEDFEVVADQEFAVSTFSLSGELQDPDDFLSRGDPAQSQSVAVEQYRTTYVFLAPGDYDVSFIDIVQPIGAAVKLDGVPLPVTPTVLGTSSFGVARVRLGAGVGGAHVVTSDQPIGIQVMGYGAYTAYQYPGGLNLQRIAAPPLLK